MDPKPDVDPDAPVEAEQVDKIAAGGVPEGSAGTGTEPGEIAPPAVFDGDVDALAELVARMPSEGQVMILLRMLERVSDERDRLRAVVDAAMLLWYATYPTGKPRPELIAARNDFERAVAQLDVSPAMGEGEGR